MSDYETKVKLDIFGNRVLFASPRKSHILCVAKFDKIWNILINLTYGNKVPLSSHSPKKSEILYLWCDIDEI